MPLTDIQCKNAKAANQRFSKERLGDDFYRALMQHQVPEQMHSTFDISTKTEDITEEEVSLC